MFIEFAVQIAQLEKEVKERAQKDTAKEQQESEVPIINPGGFGGRLLLTQGNGFPGQAPAPMMPAATGMGMPPVSCYVLSHRRCC